MANTSESVFTNSEKLISFLSQMANTKKYVFRGYGKQSELLPNIIRDKDWRSEEINLLYEFERYGLQYFSANSPIDFMSYAQHYGLPTRLLDFTYNPFTALSFALFMPKSSKYSCEKDKDYYYIRYCNVDEQIYTRKLPCYDESTLFHSDSFASQCSKIIQSVNRIVSGLHELADDSHIGEKVILDYFKAMYYGNHPENAIVDIPDFRAYINDLVDRFEEQRILFVDPNQCNQRIVMQQGLFMFPYTLDKKKHISIIENQTDVLLIHKDIREELLDYLDTIGLNSYRLMPDLQSVCQTAKRKITEKRQQESALFKKINK